VVDEADLTAVLEGRAPGSDERLTRAKLPGLDFTFRAPKSISILYGLGEAGTVTGEVVAAHEWRVSERYNIAADVCDRHRIQPTQFYLWQKQLFENGATAFERKAKSSGPSLAERQVEALQAKLLTKNEVIAELMEENILLKKLDGAI